MIASNTGGVPEIIENGYNGLLVKPGDVNELHEALVKLINNEQIRKTFGKKATEKIDLKFSSKSIEDKIDQVYQDLLNRYK